MGLTNMESRLDFRQGYEIYLFSKISRPAVKLKLPVLRRVPPRRETGVSNTSSGQIRLVARLRITGVYLHFHVWFVGVYWLNIVFLPDGGDHLQLRAVSYDPIYVWVWTAVGSHKQWQLASRVTFLRISWCQKSVSYWIQMAPSRFLIRALSWRCNPTNDVITQPS